MQSPKASNTGLIRFVLVASALTLGLLGQLLIANGSFKWAITPYVIAIGAIMLAVARQSVFPSTSQIESSDEDSNAAESSSTSEEDSAFRERARQIERRFAIAAFSISAGFLVLSLSMFPSGPPNTLAWWLYGASMVLLLLGLPVIESRWTGLIRRFKERPVFTVSGATLLQWGMLAAILMVALAVRLHDLRDVPYGVWFDEAANVLNANQIHENPGATPVFSRVIPVLYLLPSASLIDLIGLSHEAIRLVSVAFSVAGVVAVFLLARFMVGPAGGLIAAFLLAAMRWDINFSRIGMVPVTMTLFTALTAFLTLRALKTGRYSDFGFAGAAFGLGTWFYASFQAFLLVIGFIVLYHFVLRRPPIKRCAGQLALMAVVAIMMASPVIQFAATQPGTYFARAEQTSTFSIMPLGDAVESTITNLRKHVLMLHYQGDTNPRHNLPGEPMLDTLSAFLLVLGLAIAATRWRSVTMATLPVWLFVMLLPGALTLPFEAPQSLRSIGVIPAAVILATLPIVALWRVRSAASNPLTRRLALVAMMFILAAISFLNINTYFGPQMSDPRVYAAYTTDGRLIGEHMLEQQARGYTLLTSRQFKFSLQIDLAGHRPGYDVIRAPTGVPIDAERTGNGVSIYLEPREASVYRLLREYYPEGHFEEVRPPGGSEVMYYLAVLSREQLEAKQGVVATYTFDDGSVSQSIKSSMEGVWLIEFAPDELPVQFDWQGTLHVKETGEYLLALEGETDAEVLLDGRRILDADKRSTRIVPAVGLHTLEVMGRVEEHASVTRLLWQTPGGELSPIRVSNLYHDTVRPIGLAGRFYGGAQESGLPDALRVTPAMDTFWYDPVISEPYTAVWEGELDVDVGGTHRFSVEGAGDVKLFIDGELAAQRPPAERESSESVFLNTGEHDIRVEYFSPGPPSQLSVLWGTPDMPLEPIPIEKLSPSPEQMFRLIE